jgi:hypothetical protein
MMDGGHVSGFMEQATLPAVGMPVRVNPDELLQACLKQGRQEKEVLREIADQTFAEMGIHCSPILAEGLQRMMLECGIKPEENLLSQGIIAMRGE